MARAEDADEDDPDGAAAARLAGDDGATAADEGKSAGERAHPARHFGQISGGVCARVAKLGPLVLEKIADDDDGKSKQARRPSRPPPLRDATVEKTVEARHLSVSSARLPARDCDPGRAQRRQNRRLAKAPRAKVRRPRGRITRLLTVSICERRAQRRQRADRQRYERAGGDREDHVR